MGEMSFAVIIALAVSFLIGVVITRWIFGIDKIIAALKLQNEYGIMQVRLLKKMLINQGTPINEIDNILEKGNSKKEENNANIADPYARKIYEEMKDIDANKK